MFAPPSDFDSNSVLVLTQDRQLFLFGPGTADAGEKEFEDMVQVCDQFFFCSEAVVFLRLLLKGCDERMRSKNETVHFLQQRNVCLNSTDAVVLNGTGK